MSTEKDRKEAEEFRDYHFTEIVNGCDNESDEIVVQFFLAGVQHARQGERERIKRFIAKYESAIATGRLSGGEFAMTDDMVIDEFLEQEAKDGN